MMPKQKAIFWTIGLLCFLMFGWCLAFVFKIDFHRLMGLNSVEASFDQKGNPRDVDSADPEPILVKTIKPKRDPSFVLTIRELAYVEAYYEVPILSQVAGRIKFIQKDIGDPVTQGE